MKRWLRAMRAPFFTATIIPVLIAGSLTWNYDGTIDWLRFLLLFIGAMTSHASVNMYNEYYDYDVDSNNPDYTPFSGGGRTLQEKIVSKREMFVGATTAMLITVAIGIYFLFTTPGYTILIIGLIGVACIYAYNMPPIRAVEKGWGEILIFISFGPLMVLGGFYVLNEYLTPLVWFASFLSGITVMLIIWINEFPDKVTDGNSGKNTIVVRIGYRKSAYIIVGLLSLLYLSVIVLTVTGIFPLITLITLITLPLAVRIITLLLKLYSEPRKMLPANAMTIILQIVFGIVLSTAFIINHYI